MITGADGSYFVPASQHLRYALVTERVRSFVRLLAERVDDQRVNVVASDARPECAREAVEQRYVIPVASRSSERPHDRIGVLDQTRFNDVAPLQTAASYVRELFHAERAAVTEQP
jgi:hypothetical protein